MSMHLGRSKGRADGPDTSLYKAMLASRFAPGAEFAAIVARNRDAWIRERIDRGQAGTRPPFLRPAEQPRLLRVVVHPGVGAQEVRESEAALLHRLGLLWAEEEALFAAGQLPTEHCYLSEQTQHEPGVVTVTAAVWEAMSGPERRALFEETWRKATPAEADTGLVAGVPGDVGAGGELV